jgi:hypothetical protein
MIDVAYVSHRLPGRVRLRIAERRGDAAFFHRVGRALSRSAGVTRLETKPATGSVLIEHEGALEPVLDTARAAGLFELAAPPAPATAGEQLARGTALLDREVAALTAGQVNLGAALFIALVGLGLFQISRGHVLAPAVTLFWYALASLRVFGRGDLGGA